MFSFRRNKSSIIFGKKKEDPFNFDLISKYYKNKKHTELFQNISNQTYNDLDLEDVYKHVDRTITPVGQMYLYDKLLAINSNVNFSAQEEIIKHLEGSPSELSSIRNILTKLTQHKAYYLTTLFQGKHIEQPKWFFVLPLLSFTMILSLILGIFSSKILIMPIILLPFHLGIHYYNKLKVNIYIDAIPQLLALNSTAKKLIKKPIINKFFNSINSDIKTINQIKRRMSVFKLEQKVDSEMEMLYWFLLELIKITFLMEPLLLFSMIGKLKNKRTEIEAVFCFVGEIDSIQSIHALRRNAHCFCAPTIDKELKISATDLYHPLIENAVPNSFEMSDKSFLLTGSNMSGKTTFIRTIGINVITGLTLNTCFAKKFSAPKMQVLSMIRISDDLNSDSSYFLTEVKQMKVILDLCSSSSPSLILLDELFKGTNTKERVATAHAILSHLQSDSNFILVSTHDFELTTDLTDQFENYHFTEKLNNDKLVFNYKLTPGVLNETNALRILEMYDYPKEIIITAKEIKTS